jgi:predicted PurR-regulated permease PerM
MALLDSNQSRAQVVIILLAAGLLVALTPYVSGLIWGLVLYVVFSPVHDWLLRWLNRRAAAGAVIVLLLLLLVVPTVTFAGLVVDQAQSIAGSVARGPLLDRLATLEIGGFAIGPRLAGLGEQVISWITSSAFGLLGTATRLGLNLTITLFITYYLLLNAGRTWVAAKPYIPFSSASAELLRERFRDVTISTMIGTGLVAVIQGTLVGLGFWLTGLSNAVFWGVVTVVVAVLPVVGSGLVWGPGALTLFLSGHVGAAIALAAVGILAVGNVDFLVRPAIFRRYAQIHPLVTLVGAIGGVGYFGLLGLLIGPLAISYFFELIRIYNEEYLHAPPVGTPLEPPSPIPAA